MGHRIIGHATTSGASYNQWVAEQDADNFEEGGIISHEVRPYSDSEASDLADQCFSNGKYYAGPVPTEDREEAIKYFQENCFVSEIYYKDGALKPFCGYFGEEV